MIWALTQVLWILCFPCLWSNQRSNLDALKPEESQANPVSPSLQGQAAPGDEVHEDGSRGLGFEDLEDRVVGRQLADGPFGVSIPEIAHEAATGDGGVHLEDGGEKEIRDREWPSSCLGAGRLGNASTEIPEQDLESVFLVRLGGVVGRPALTEGLAPLLSGSCGRGCFKAVSLDRNLDGPDVLAPHSTDAEVGAGASGDAVQTDRVVSRSTLRRDNPLPSILNDRGIVGDAKSSLLSLIHGFSFSCHKGRGRIADADLARCRERLVGYGPAGRSEHPAGPLFSPIDILHHPVRDWGDRWLHLPDPLPRRRFTLFNLLIGNESFKNRLNRRPRVGIGQSHVRLRKFLYKTAGRNRRSVRLAEDIPYSVGQSHLRYGGLGISNATRRCDPNQIILNFRDLYFDNSAFFEGFPEVFLRCFESFQITLFCFFHGAMAFFFFHRPRF